MGTTGWAQGTGAAIAVAVALVVGLGAGAQAQDQAVELYLERYYEVAPEDMLNLVPGWVAEISTIVQSLESLDASTRRGRGDTDGLPCVVDDLSNTRRLKEAVDAAQPNMEGYLGQGNLDLARFEFRKVVVALLEARGLQGNATRCAEGAGLQEGALRRNVTQQGSGSGDDMAPVPDDIVDFAFDPFDASPF